MRRFSSCVSAVVVLAWSAVAAAGTLKVPSGFGSIQDAVDAAGSGDVIEVSKGTYVETVLIASRSGITIRAKGKVLVRAGDGSPCVDVQASSGIVLEKLRFSGALGPAIKISNSTDVVVSRCRVLDAGGDGVRTDASSRITISRCKIENVGGDGVALSVGNRSGPTNESVVERNKFRNCGDDAIDIHGDDNRIERNKIVGTREDGIELDEDTGGNRNTFTKNKISGVPGRGFVIVGDDNVLVRCVVKRSGDDAFAIHGDRNRVERCKAVSAGFDGLYVTGDQNQIIRHVSIKARDDGADIEGAENVMDGVVSKRAGDNGFEVNGSGNTLRGCKASKSGTFDLNDTDGRNFYERGNRFGSQKINT